MHVHAELDAVHRRQAAFRAESAAGRLATLARRPRAPARRLVAKLIVAFGFVVVDAGRRLDDDAEVSDRRRLRVVS
jgi:hypothetical protein